MSGEIHNTSTQVKVVNHTLTLDNFRELTVGRNINKGTLKLVKDKTSGEITGLRCSKHHIWRSIHKPSVNDADAIALKSELKNVLDRELKEIFNFNKKEFKNLPQSRLDALEEKRQTLLTRFEKRMTIRHKNPETKKMITDGVQRSTIKKIVERMDILKNLSADKLLNYDIKALCRLLDNKGVGIAADEQAFQSAQAERGKAYADAVKAMKTAGLDDLKQAGNDLLRTCFKNIKEAKEFTEVDETLFNNGIKCIFHDPETGDLTFHAHASNAEIQADFEKLLGAVALKKSEQKLNKELGGDLAKDEINAALKDFTGKLKAADDEVEKAIPALAKNLGQALEKVTDPETLLKAANTLLQKGDFGLARLAKMDAGSKKHTDMRNIEIGRITTAFEKNKSSLVMTANGELALKDGADIGKIQEDIGRLLAALTKEDIAVNGSSIGDVKALRKSLCYDAYDIISGRRSLPQALREFTAILTGGNKPGNDDYHPILENGDGEDKKVEDKLNDYHPILENGDDEKTGENEEEEIVKHPGKNTANKAQKKFTIDQETVNRMKGKIKVKEPLIPLEEEEIINKVEEEISTKATKKTEEMAEGEISAKATKKTEKKEVKSRLNNRAHSKPLTMLKRLARYTGGLNGKARGYIGIDESDRFFKFLTHSGEKLNANAYSPEEKQLINTATDKLRALILEIADGLGLKQEVKDAVITKFPSSAIQGNGLKDFFQRDTVAEIVNIIGESARGDSLGEQGVSAFDWKDIKPAVDLSNTKIEKVFNLDEKRVFAQNKGKSMTWVEAANIKKRLNDKDVQKKLADEPLTIQKTETLLANVDKKPSATSKMKKYSRRVMTGGATGVAEKLIKANPGKKVTLVAAGDDRYAGCYYGEPVNSQEENVLQDLDPNFLAMLKAHKLVKGEAFVNKRNKDPITNKPPRYDKLEYTGAYGKRHSPMSGYYTDTKLIAADHKIIDPPQDVGLFIGAAPSFTNSIGSRDLLGNLDFLIRCRDEIGDKEVGALLDALNKEEEDPKAYKAAVKKLENAYKFIQTAWDKVSKLKGMNDKADFRDAMMLMMFSGKQEGIDVFSSDYRKEAAKLASLVDNRNKNLSAYKKSVAAATDNYKETMRTIFRDYILAARAAGTDILVVPPIGCGVFFNDPAIIMDCLAEAVVLYSGDMEVVYNQHKENPKEANRVAYETALEKYARKYEVDGAPEEEKAPEAPKAANGTGNVIPSNASAAPINLETDIDKANLGGTVSFGTYNVLETDEDPVLAGQMGKALADANVDNIRNGYTFVLNKLSRNLKYLKEGSEDKEKEAYLNFLKRAEEIIGSGDEKDILKALKKEIQNDRAISDGLTARLNLALDEVAKRFGLPQK